ncbi:MAG: PEP-CTERM sorting domain-containing protein, partial [Deltaproteobacteria bacterium]|nr:PEP-CTERM sorting domain-containing protein [Deltaproteobacteria bacterium]
ASALTLDWDTDPWPGTTATSHTVNVDGDDVVISIDDPNDVIDHGTSNGTPGSVVSGPIIDPPSNAGASNLFIKTDANTSPDWVTITLQFEHAGGVRDLSFSVFDVDQMTPFWFFPGYTDQLEIVGLHQGTEYDPTITALDADPSWTLDDPRTVTGTRRVGETDEAGTVAVGFGGQTLDELRVTYRNSLSTGQAQWIGFSPFTFERAPEPSTAAMLGLGLTMLALKRRRRADR